MELRTERLRLRPYQLEDIDALHALWTDRDVRRYLWDNEVISRERAAATVTSSMQDWAASGYGQWTIWLLDPPEFIGFGGFRPADWCTDPELLIGLKPRYWDRGLATEAASAALHYGFRTLGFAQVVAATDVPNLASVRVMERLGMRCERRGRLNRLDTLFYVLAREDFVPGDSVVRKRGA